jgi:hypothetical protein
MTIDVIIYPLHRQQSRDLGRLPGLHAAEPPRNASRSRKSDQLILLLSFDVPAFSDDRLHDLLTRLESIYYQKTGSTTAAMRELIDELNSLILNLNLKNAGSRAQVTGTAAVLVLRGDLLFLAQCGPGHPFALLPGKVDYLHDENLNLRSIGGSRTPAVYFAQVQLSPGDRFLFATTLPDGWDADTFTAAYSGPVAKARQRFMEDAGDALKGTLLQCETGSGRINLAQPAPPQDLSQDQALQPAQEQPSVQGTPPNARPMRASLPPEEAQPTRTPSPSRTERPATGDLKRSQPAADFSEPAPRQRRQPAELPPALQNAAASLKAFGQRILRGIKAILQRLVPGDELVKIPAGTMAFIAVAVPLLVVTVAALIYAQIGRNQQYDLYFSQAETMAQAATAETDPAAQRQAWQETVALADTALGYLVTDEAESLRNLAADSIDALDQIKRLTLEPAINGALSSAIKIRNIQATSRDLYMLDITSDSVLRAWLAGSRYEMDGDFRCGAGQYGSIIVKDLIDISLLPDNPDKAVLVAMDHGGNLLYCFEDRAPVAITLTPPDSFWGRPVAITVENDRLYVLDEQLNMVWYYLPPDDGSYQYREAPLFFFTEEVPDMKDAIDFAIDQELLYLLYLNGTTTTCTFTGLDEAPTSCTAPATYNDTRPGRTPGPNISDAVFYQIQHTQPPEPSLYYLDPVNRSIYHFSLKLNLVQQYRPEEGLEEGFITAFAISPTKTIFLAMENKIYLTHLP